MAKYLHFLQTDCKILVGDFKMSGILLGSVSILYFAAGINYLVSGNTGMAIAFVCYGIANYGLYLAGS